MKDNFRLSKNKEPLSYRQSVSILSSQLIRNSFSGGSSRPNIFRESLGLQTKTRNTMNLQMMEHILRQLECQRIEKEKVSFSNLKSTLSDLEKKVKKAKKQLNTYKNIISQQQSESEDQAQLRQAQKNLKFKQQISTITSSGSKIELIKKDIDMTKFQRLKSYYLSHLSEALQGKDSRAMQHVIVSHKVLRNYYKIEQPSQAAIEKKKIDLPRAKQDMHKKTLILDIDQTIIHCEQDSSKPYDIMLPIEIQNGSIAQAYISIRPYAISFIKRMSKIYEIIAFTASHQSYADVVLDQLDPERKYIKHRLYRKNCIQIHQNIYAKDLRIINRDFKSMVLVDNAPYSYIFQLQNGIPILPYYTGQDKQLIQLEKYLQEMAKYQDVRQLNKKTFQFHKYGNFHQAQDLIMGLYFKQV